MRISSTQLFNGKNIRFISLKNIQKQLKENLQKSYLENLMKFSQMKSARLNEIIFFNNLRTKKKRKQEKRMKCKKDE